MTVLTSIETEDLRGIDIAQSVEERVLSLAQLSHKLGLDGVVCSAQETGGCGNLADFCLVTPYSFRASSTDDQRRVLSPECLASGSDYLVIGRPITQHPEPPNLRVNLP